MSYLFSNNNNLTKCSFFIFTLNYFRFDFEIEAIYFLPFAEKVREIQEKLEAFIEALHKEK